MKPKKWIESATLLITLIIIGGGAHSIKQSEKSNLIEKRLTVKVTQATLIYVLDTLAVDHGIPIGLEKSSAHKDEYNIDVSIEGGTLKEVLDSIVQQYPMYRWKMNEGVINFTPSQYRNELVAKFLNESIRHYEPTNIDGKFEIRESIYQMPEVKGYLIAHALNPETIEKWLHDIGVVYDDGKVDLSISNTNVRGVLNKIVKDSKHKIWVADLLGKNKDRLIISF
jgi:hypothetical protein